EDHFAILKVGPWLTFAYREAIFSLSSIERELLGRGKGYRLSQVREALRPPCCRIRFIGALIIKVTKMSSPSLVHSVTATGVGTIGTSQSCRAKSLVCSRISPQLRCRCP